MLTPQKQIDTLIVKSSSMFLGSSCPKNRWKYRTIVHDVLHTPTKVTKQNVSFRDAVTNQTNKPTVKNKKISNKVRDMIMYLSYFF